MIVISCIIALKNFYILALVIVTFIVNKKLWSNGAAPPTSGVERFEISFS